MIAGGVESMSMVPMGGNTPSMSPEIFMGDENIGIAYGMGRSYGDIALNPNGPLWLTTGLSHFIQFN